MMRFVTYIFAVAFFSALAGLPAHATSSSLVIAQVQAGTVSTEAAAPTQEFVSIYNNSAQDVDVTGWCITNKSGNNVACLTATQPGQTLYLPSHQYMIMASDSFAARYVGIIPDVTFATTNAASGSFVGSSDTVSLKDKSGVVVDSMAWTSSLSGGTVLQRSASSDLVSLIDTDNATDFTKVQGVVLPVSGIYEVLTVIDQCRNLADIQTTIPVNYLQDSEGNCYEDVCRNLDGLQLTIPEEYVRRGADECVYNYPLLKVTELLPNVGGSDTGHEYIEFYNPTNKLVTLANYQLQVGTKLYDFPIGATIGPGEYRVFYNSEVNFTLVNTTTTVTLLGDDGSVIDQPAVYDTPDEDTAWSLIDEVWQYTNQPTPGDTNIVSIAEPIEEVIGANEDKQLAPCAANQYRNPETNRCRLLVTLAKAVTPCKDGQYRSEETNRCRSIALAGSTLTPCREDQYRSEETNRCRNIATATSTLTPCKDNQYRSEETNRCRNIAAAVMPSAAFAVEPVTETGKAFVGWWALGGVVVLALGYGVWEWRREIAIGVGRLAAFFRFRK